MALRIIKQPNNLYAVWLTVTDSFICINYTLDDLREMLIKRKGITKENVDLVILEKLDCNYEWDDLIDEDDIEEQEIHDSGKKYDIWLCLRKDYCLHLKKWNHQCQECLREYKSD